MKRRYNILQLRELLIKQPLRPVISEICSIITAITRSIPTPRRLELLRSLVVTCIVMFAVPSKFRIYLNHYRDLLRDDLDCARETRAVNRYSLPESDFNRTPTACFLFIYFFFSPRFDCF